MASTASRLPHNVMQRNERKDEPATGTLQSRGQALLKEIETSYPLMIIPDQNLANIERAGEEYQKMREALVAAHRRIEALSEKLREESDHYQRVITRSQDQLDELRKDRDDKAQKAENAGNYCMVLATKLDGINKAEKAHSAHIDSLIKDALGAAGAASFAKLPGKTYPDRNEPKDDQDREDQETARNFLNSQQTGE